MDNFLMRTPWTIVTILAVYYYFVQHFGKKWMKNREPYQLNTIINIYNLIQVALNASMVVLVSE
jgi:hypothetical protein